MESPIRLYQKQKDYQRHKLFRKIKRRRERERKNAINAPIKELRRRMKQPVRFRGGKDQNKEKKYGYDVEYMSEAEAMKQLADNMNRTAVMDEVVVTPSRRLPMQSELSEGITNQAANERADEYANRVTPTAEDLLNIGTLGGLNNLSPTQWARRAYDLREAMKGNMSWDKFGNNWFYGNNGLLPDEYAQEHPYASAAVNLVGDVGAFGTFSALRKLPEYAALMEAENRAAQEAAASNWRDMFSNSVKRTRIGDVEIDNPGLYYHQSDAGKAKNFVSTGRMRTPFEEYWLAKERAGEHIPIMLRAGMKPGYPQNAGSAMFSQGNLWYDKLDGIRINPMKPDLLVTAREMPIANKNASIMSDKASLKALYGQGTRRVTNDNIYTQGPHTPQNTSAYTWEPGYGYRRVFTEETPTLNLSDAARTPKITADNAASITPEQWTVAQDVAIARGDMAEAQRLRDLHFKVSAPNTVASINGQPLQLYHGTDFTFNTFDLSKYGKTDSGTFGRGVYTTPIKTYAELYGKNIMPLYMKLDNPRDYRNVSIGDLMAEKLAFGDDFATGIGIDGVIGRPSWKGFKGLEEYVAHNPENIKSSKAVTFDDNGVRIPLGERDNFGVNDIRYGLLPIVGMGALKALDKDGQIGFIDFNIGYQKGKDKNLQPPKFQKGTDDNRVQITERTYPDGSVRYFTGDIELEPVNTMDTDDMSMWTWQEKNRPYITYSGLGAKRNTEEIRQGKNKTAKDKILEFSNKHYADPILGAPARWRESWNNDTNPVKAIVDSGIAYGTPYGPAQGIYDLVKSAEAVKTGKGSFLDYLMAVPAVTAINDARKGLRAYKNATNTTLPDFSGWDIERIQAYLNSHPESIYSHKLGSLIDYSKEGASDIKYAEDRVSNFLKNDVYPRFVANTKRPITEEDKALFGANGLPEDVNASYTNLNGSNYGGWYNDNNVVINQAKDSPDNILTHELEHAQRDRLNTYGLLNDFDFADSYVNGYTPSEIRALNNAYNFGDDFTYKLGNIGSINEKGATNRELRYAISSDYGETGKALDDIIDKMSIEDLKQYLNTTNAYSKDFLKNAGSDFYKNVKEALKYVPATVGLTVATDSYNKGKDIYIKPSKRGTFTAAAKKRGMSVQQFASKVLKAPKGKYSTSMRKKANFAKNASKWKK